MARFQQTDTSASFVVCASGAASGSTNVGRQATRGGTAGSTEVTVNPGNTTAVALLFETDAVGNHVWPAGDYTVFLNVTTANGASWVNTYLCERDSGGSTVAELSVTNHASVDISTAGVVSATITLNSDHTPAGDGSRMLFTLEFQGAEHGGADFGITPDQVIETPQINPLIGTELTIGTNPPFSRCAPPDTFSSRATDSTIFYELWLGLDGPSQFDADILNQDGETYATGGQSDPADPFDLASQTISQTSAQLTLALGEFQASEGEIEYSWEVHLFDLNCTHIGLLAQDTSWYDPAGEGSTTKVFTIDTEAAFDAGTDQVLVFLVLLWRQQYSGAQNTDVSLENTLGAHTLYIGEIQMPTPEGGSTASVSVATAGAGEKSAEAGSSSTVQTSTAGAGTKATDSGANAPVTVAASGAGEKTADGGSTAAVEVTATGAGESPNARTGGSVSSVSVAVQGDGVKGSEAGASASLTVQSTGAGEKSAQGGAGASVTVAATADGESSLPPPGALTYGPWEQQVTIGGVSGAFVRDMAIRWNTRARVDQASFTVEDMPSMAATFDACELGASVTVIQTDGNVSVRFDGFIVSASDERGTNWTQRKVECHSDEAKAKWVRFQREFDNREADKIATSLWTDYGNTAAPNGFDIQPNSQRIDLTSSFDSLFDVMEELCRRTAWAWRIEQGVAKFFDPLSEESPAYDQSANDLEADTLNVARDTRQIVNSIRTPVWIYRTKRKTVKAIAAEDCVKIVRARDLYPPAGWELVGEPEIVEDFAPDGFDREARLTEDGWLEFDPPLIPEDQAEPGSLFLQFYAEVVVEVTHRRQVWLLMESADSIAEYGRREGQPLNDDGGQSMAEGEQLLTEYLARHAFPTVEVSGSALKFGYRRDTIANVSLIDPPLAAPLYVTSVKHTTQGNELQVQLDFASPDTVLDSGSSGGQRPTTSDVDVVHELTRRIIQLERRDAHPLGILGLTTSEVGSLSPADRVQEGAGWGEKTTGGAGTTEGFAEGSGWGESVSAVVQ